MEKCNNDIPPSLIGSNGLESSSWTNSATKSGRSDLSQRQKSKHPVFKAPQVSMRPQSSPLDGLEPESKVTWGRPLLMAMGIGGRIGAGDGRGAEKDLTWRSRNLAFFRIGGGTGRARGTGGAGPGGAAGAGLVEELAAGLGTALKDWVGGTPGVGGAGRISYGCGGRFRR